ncbi:MAG: FAD-binding oxidoreductase [bacterium]
MNNDEDKYDGLLLSHPAVNALGELDDLLLRDESRKSGIASSFSYPMSVDEVSAIISRCNIGMIPVTIQGARTGIAAGAVPGGGHVMNLSRMKVIGEVVIDGVDKYITVQAGATLAELRGKIAGTGLYFPPDPTESSASIGGMVACNASGALTFRYGPVRNWVRRIQVVHADGQVKWYSRGEKDGFVSANNGVIECGGVEFPEYIRAGVKSAAGYYLTSESNCADIFIGSEGTLGIITEIELHLIDKPRHIVGLTTYLPSEEVALQFVRFLRGEVVGSLPVAEVIPCAIEFFNADVLNLLRKMKTENPAFEKLPNLKPHYHTAVYAEFHNDDAEVIDGAVMAAMEAMMELGGSDEDTWYADKENDLNAQKDFRHATPEAVNLLIDGRKKTNPEITKLGTDMSVPDDKLLEVMAMYNDGLKAAGLESVIFGHIGNNHVHVNILPRSMEEFWQGKKLYKKWAEQIVAMGGSISAEHGIGKMKKELLLLMYGDEIIKKMVEIKNIFDPNGILGKGTLFDF